MADRSDYPAFVASCWTRLLRTAYLLVQDWAAAEDLTQAALVKAWLAWPRLDDNPEAYVRKIIVTTHVSWWRRRWRNRELPTGQPPERPDAASATDAVDERDAVWRALGRLPAGQRAVVVLRYFEDMTEAQVAGILGCSAGTVKSQTSRALGQPDGDVDWRLAAYAWTPPATVRAAPAAPRLPFSYTGANTTNGYGQVPRRLVARRSGDWPGDRTATITVTYHRGRSLDISVVCAGAIASRLQVSFQVDGSSSQQVPCTAWTPGLPPTDTTTLAGRAGVPVTLTFRFQAPSPDTAAAYAKRAASWIVAVYEEQT